jgi:hypothetical protein
MARTGGGLARGFHAVAAGGHHGAVQASVPGCMARVRLARLSSQLALPWVRLAKTPRDS